MFRTERAKRAKAGIQNEAQEVLSLMEEPGKQMRKNMRKKRVLRGGSCKPLSSACFHLGTCPGSQDLALRELRS